MSIYITDPETRTATGLELTAACRRGAEIAAGIAVAYGADTASLHASHLHERLLA